MTPSRPTCSVRSTFRTPQRCSFPLSFTRKIFKKSTPYSNFRRSIFLLVPHRNQSPRLMIRTHASSSSYNGELSFVAEDGGDTIPTDMFGPTNLSNTPTLFLSTLFLLEKYSKKYSVFEFSTFNLPPHPPSESIPTTHDPYT